MSESVLAAVAAALGSGVAASESAGSGDVNQGLRVELDDGRAVFVKYREGAPAGMYEAEAAGLAWLADGGAPTPSVVAVGK
ncbi:MAG: fructosamine kinase family protein, partial [Miltoncostaeaceae bacterium]